MAKQLSEKQKKVIDRLLQSDKGTSADETVEDTIKKKLKLSNEEYGELESEIDKCITGFFEKFA
jgi:hypothetical protein